MTTACFKEAIDFVRDAFGDEAALTKGQLRDVIERMKNRSESLINKDPAITQEQAFETAATEVINEMQQAAKQQKKDTILNILARRNMLKHAEKFDFKPEGLMTIMTRVASTNIKGSADHIDNISGTNLLLLTGGKDGVITRLEKEGLLEKYQSLANYEGEEQLAKAMSGEDVEDEDVAKIGKIIRENQEIARKLQNKFGAGIKTLDDWIAPTSHNPLQMLVTADSWKEHNANLARLIGKSEEGRNIAFNRWYDFEINILDHDRTFKDIPNTEDARRKFMRSVFNDFISSIHDKFDISGAPKAPLSRGGTFAGRLRKSRVLHYKDAASWLQHIRKYGNGSLRQSIEDSFTYAAKNMAILEKMGPDATGNYEIVKRVISKKNRGLPRLKSKLKALDNVFGVINGISSSPVNYKFANVASNYRSFINWTKLGFVMFGSIPDVANMASELRFNGIGFLDRWGQSLGNLKNLLKSEKQFRETADLLGVSAEAMMGYTNRLSIGDNESGIATKLNQIFFKLNGLRKWDLVHRTGTINSLARNLANQRGLRFSNLDEDLKNVLGLYNIGERDWEVMRKVPTKRKDGKLFVSPDSIRDASDKLIKDVFGEDVPRGTSKIRIDIENKFMRYFHDRASNVIINPTSRTRAVVLQGTRPGTPMGEAARLMAQFKMYSVGFTRDVLGRHLGGGASGKADIQGLAELVVSMGILNYIGMSAKAILQNKTPPDPTKGRTIFRALVPGLGIFGDFMAGEYNKYNRSLLKSAAGPGLSNLSRGVGLVYSEINAIINDGKQPTKAAFYLGKSNTPFINLWFLAGGFQYLIAQAIENRINPGAAMRARNRMIKENNQDFIFAPQR